MSKREKILIALSLSLLFAIFVFFKFPNTARHQEIILDKEIEFVEQDINTRADELIAKLQNADDEIEVGEPVQVETQQESGITMVLIPVEHKIISNQSEYKKFKNQHKGSYPDIDFSKNNLIYIITTNGMPNSMIRIVDAYKKDNKQVIEYITSVAALANQNLPPTYIMVEKSKDPIHLLQVPYRE